MNVSPPLPPPPPETLAPQPPVLAPSPPSRWVVLARDHTWQAFLGLALLAHVALLAYLWLRFDTLPDLLPFHFDSTGLADRIEAKSNIWSLPVIGAIVLVVNAVIGIALHQRERAATILLLTGALLVQILLWLAVNGIIGGINP